MSTLLHPAIHNLRCIKDHEVRTHNQLEVIRAIRALHELEHQIGYLAHLEGCKPEQATLEALTKEINHKFFILQEKLKEGYDAQWLQDWLTDLQDFHTSFHQQSTQCKLNLTEKINEQIKLQASIRMKEIARLFFGFLTIFGGIIFAVGVFMEVVILGSGATMWAAEGFSPQLRAWLSIIVGGMMTAVGIIGLHHYFTKHPHLERRKYPRRADKIDPAAAYTVVVERMQRVIAAINKKHRR